jgi:glucose-1-phosphate cytidylyltransferase
MKVVILCGGMGTRLREETEYKPKPMVEIGGRPILWHIMKIYAYFGYKEFVLALGYKGNVIRDYFLNYRYYNCDFTVEIGKHNVVECYRNHDEYDWKVTLVETGPDSMTGYRLKLCDQYIEKDNFMLTYGDAVANVDIRKLVEFHLSMGTVGTVTGVFPPSRFGDLTISGNLVEKFKEKEITFNKKSPINGGFFVFKKEFLDMIPLDRNCDLERAPLENLCSAKQLSVFNHYGFWQCMDTYRDYVLLNRLWNDNPEWKVWGLFAPRNSV